MSRDGVWQGDDWRPARLRALFLNTATVAPLGADTWVLAQLMADLDRDFTEVHTALNPSRSGTSTPTYEVVRNIPELQLLHVNLGPEAFGRSRWKRWQTLVEALPAIPSAIRLAWYVRQRRIDVIHTTDRPRDALTCVLVARLTGAKSLIHCHVAFADWMSGMLRWSIRHADAVVAISDFVANALLVGGVEPKRLHVVRNGIRPADWHPGRRRAEVRAEFGIDDDESLIVTVCRLFPGKGTAELIRAVAATRSRVPGVRLVVVGHDITGGRYLDELQDLVVSLDLDGHVQFTGRRPDIEGVMAAADVYAMPSTGEPFGLVFAEAMAMRLPVVALGDGGTPEVVEDGRTGLLSGAGDIDTLAGNLERLLIDADLRASMGEAGRARVESRFTTGRMASEMAEVYSLVASR